MIVKFPFLKENVLVFLVKHTLGLSGANDPTAATVPGGLGPNNSSQIGCLKGSMNNPESLEAHLYGAEVEIYWPYSVIA